MNLLSSERSPSTSPLSHRRQPIKSAQKAFLAEVMSAGRREWQLHDVSAEEAAEFCRHARNASDISHINQPISCRESGKKSSEMVSCTTFQEPVTDRHSADPCSPLHPLPALSILENQRLLARRGGYEPLPPVHLLGEKQLLLVDTTHHTENKDFGNVRKKGVCEHRSPTPASPPSS